MVKTSWQSEQDGVRIPRQILMSHDLNGPIRYRLWWRPLSEKIDRSTTFVGPFVESHATNWVERKNRTKGCWSLAWRPTYWLKRRFTIVLTRGKGERKVNRFVDLPLPVRLRQREGAGPKNEQEPQLSPSSWLRVRFRDRALSALRKSGVAVTRNLFNFLKYVPSYPRAVVLATMSQSFPDLSPLLSPPL